MPPAIIPISAHIPKSVPVVIPLLLLVLPAAHPPALVIKLLHRALSHGFLQVLGPLRVRARPALGPVGAEARQVKGAQFPPDMFLGAQGA
ncbi:hypothetical protein PT974_06281 [Cladobotryum mycophilum]|uniref:Secreted protein n=1 Tax=Cladobotryum mycophilum TaxID=491253 RepID=A0ABR0SL15_9HYPO